MKLRSETDSTLSIRQVKEVQIIGFQEIQIVPVSWATHLVLWLRTLGLQKWLCSISCFMQGIVNE